MSNPDLVSVRHKIDWAKDHLAQFDKSFATFKTTSAFTCRHTAIEPQPDGALFKFEFTCNDSLPEWSLHVGDCIHNLRSALDHLICQLATRAGNPTACEWTNFPIFLKDDAAFQKAINRLVAVLPSGAEAELHRAQPHQRRPHDAESDPLFLLSKLDNIDKHRFLLAVDPKFAEAFATLRIGNKSQGPVRLADHIPHWSPLKNKTVFFRLRIKGTPPPGNTKVNVDMDASTGIVFANTGLRCDGGEVSSTVTPIVDEVVSTVDRFERVFWW
jgi:hypothetical protein